MTDINLPISNLTMSAVLAACFSAINKHGKHQTTLSDQMDSREKLTILVEEVGEVAHQLTHDVADDTDALTKELLQVASVALMWVESLDT